jgi:GT2 family glycosyltransferase/ADP-heptose:LPS heptosyltransferase
MKKLSIIIKKYIGLGKMAWDELQKSGLDGVVFAVKRHIKKRQGKLITSYPMVNDYTKNLVTIGILTKDRLDLIKPCVESVLRHSSEKYEVQILIGDTGTKDKDVKKFYKMIKKKYKNVEVVFLGNYFFSKNYNQLIRFWAKGQYLILLNNDTVVKAGWIDALVDPLKNKQIGITGGKLLYQDETIQHAGIEYNAEGNGYHIHAKKQKDIPEVNFKALVPGVTFACVAMRHDVYDRFQLSEEFKEESQDTDFCLRLQDAGFKILYNPQAEIYHLECSSRDWRKGEEDRRLLREKWGKVIVKLAQQAQQRMPYDENLYDKAICVIRDDGLGDLLMGVSAFKNLRKKYPDNKLVMATYERNIEVMKGFGVFDEFIPIPNGKKYSPLPIPDCKKIYNFIDLEMTFGPIAGVTKEDNKINRHDVYTRDMQLDPKFELLSMPVYPAAQKAVDDLLQEYGIKEGDKLVVFNLIASNPARSWYSPYYPALFEAINEMGFTVVITGITDSEFFTGKKVVNLVGKTKTIPEFIEVVRKAKYVVSTDTSAYHIAALCGIPFLAIFTGGVLPESRLSYYDKYEVVESDKKLPCYPCWDEGCIDPLIRWKKEPCRVQLKPERVISAFKQLVEKYP